MLMVEPELEWMHTGTGARLTPRGQSVRLESAIKERAGWDPESSSWLCWWPASLRRRTSLILARGDSRNHLTNRRPY